jgi:hypothetical protein
MTAAYVSLRGTGLILCQRETNMNYGYDSAINWTNGDDSRTQKLLGLCLAVEVKVLGSADTSVNY